MSELLPFQKKKGIMVDIETLSTHPTAVVVSIGACKFDFDGSKIEDTFKINVDPKSCKALGCHIEQSTIDWWMTQPREARHAWQTDPVSVNDAILKLTEWWDSDRMLYINGLSFDAPILTNLYFALGIKKPWHYSQEMDLRTIYSMVGFSNQKARQNDKEHQYHDALQDALAQTKQLMEFFRY